MTDTPANITGPDEDTAAHAPGPVHVRMTGIHKRFGPIEVLRGVDLVIRGGEVHILAGENGAGKSTLLKILDGIHTDFDGTIEIGGRAVHPRSPQDAEAMGIAMIHQELSLVSTMSVADNLVLGLHPTRGGLVRERLVRDVARRALRQVGLDELDPSRIVRTLPISVQQLIEIAKAVRRDASVIVMDEPTSALSEPEVERLFGLIGQLTRDGRGVVYISHRMEEIQRIGDRVTVLRDGELTGSGPIERFPEDRLIECMLGRSIEPVEHEARAATEAPERLRVHELTCRPHGRETAVSDVSFTLRAGEVMGIAGVQGSGASELLNALFGTYGRPVSGRLHLDGDPIQITDPRRSIRNGIALLTNDRKATGLVLPMSVTTNMTLASLPRLTRRGWCRPARERARAADMGRRLDIRVPSFDASIAALSGGNQQKVAIAKWLMTEPRVLLLDEPTRGIDVGAKQDVYRLVQRWTRQGIAILLVTSEMRELLDLSDRIVVLHRGGVTARLDRSEVTPEAVLAAAMGRVY